MTGRVLLLVLLSYLVGSIPFGYLIGRWRGVDVRRTGSGNIGATNVIRATGRVLGGVTFLLDGAKGAVGPALSLLWGLPLAATVAAGFAAVLGHCFPIFLRLRGGKGVATFVGAFAGVDLGAALAGGVAFLVSLVTLRYTAVSSMVLVSTTLAASVWRHGALDERAAMAALSAALLAVRHRDNWRRMSRGTEGKLWSSTGPPSEEGGMS